MRRIALTHTIAERFVRPVTLGTHWLRLRPAPHARAQVGAYSLRIGSRPHFLNWTRDAFGNHVARLDFPEPVTGLGIEVDVVATIDDASPFDFLVDGSAAEHPYRYDAQLEKELVPYLEVGSVGPSLAVWLCTLHRHPRYAVDRLDDLVTAVHGAIAWDGTPGRLPDVEAALARRTGTSADLAWLLTLSLRALGIAARIVTGYRVGLDDDACVHAWSEAYLPGAGWIGLDPAAGLFATARHVPLACASDPLRARPVVGYREWCEETADETIVVRALESTGSSWPYGAAEWAAIRTLAEGVDVALDEAGVRLAAARDVVLVSSLDGGSPDWTTSALGDRKLATARALARDLRDDLVPGGVVQTSSGEWYAGEATPRWRLVCAGRADGVPVWRDPVRLASDDATVAAAEALGAALARALGVESRWCVHAYEDPLRGLGRDGTSAPSVADLRDPDRRRRVADELSERRLGRPVGVVLPLGWDHEAERWGSGAWTFRRGRLYLLEGTLPIGFRLPLESLPVGGVPPPDVERCEFAALGPLGDFHAEAIARSARPPHDDRAHGPRTAVCIEPRDGRLCVFLPPLVDAARYLSLVAAVEVAAETTGLSVVVEGYEPPEDARLRRIVLEPDVGALRVALPASVGWSEHADWLQRTYAHAASFGLTAERWSADGVREPVGAVAPLALAGPSPATSPFLDRPALLRALVVYWQRHPSLSYLFSPRMIGAGVRPDEGRDDALHELTIALERIPSGGDRPPWLVDRLLRHVLADRSGDARLAETRIDALYDPVRASRRLGRVVLRSFDAAPVAAMAAVESLLVRALVASFARDARAYDVLRFGDALHDRWLLPTVLWHDLRDVLADLRAAGTAFELRWFEPFRDLHFPLLGRAEIGDAALELRPAHEPWPVLAEEVAASGVARFIDSANDRLEVRATGLTPSRHVLACNGRRVPLRPTALEGEWVAGVRYKRWNPIATLRPTTWPVGELVFDVIDVWTGMAIGGCRFVPSPPTPLGAVAKPVVAAEPPSDGGRPPRATFLPAAWQPGGRGRFGRGGTGLGPMAAPPAELDVGHLLDLTISA